MTILQILQSASDHHRAGRLPQAERLYRTVLAEQPQNADALHFLGVLAGQTGHYRDACELINKAIASHPTADCYYNLSSPLSAMGQFARAIDALRQAIALQPRFEDAHAQLGVLLHNTGQLDQAILALQQAVSLNPRSPQFLFYLGNALVDAQQYHEAIAAFEAALILDPKAAGTLHNLSNAQRSIGLHEKALAGFQRASELNPESSLHRTSYLFNLQFYSDDPELILREHRKWDQQYASKYQSEIHPFSNDRSPDRRLRIGYVSPEFRQHCQALFTTALFPHHDREQFEIYGYSAVMSPDSVTAQLQANASSWRDISRLADQAIAEQIRTDKIDILVDLTMHMANSRPLLFARKPAPVQACWLAYPGTTGLSTMDFRLTDPCLDPPGFENRYTEQSIHLPRTFWCYDPRGMQTTADPPLPETNELPALKNKFITFGCLNDLAKINPATIARWGRLMQSVENSRLRLLSPRGSCRQWVIDQFQQWGINADRIIFVDRQPRVPYLAEYHHIDLCLDTLPYNGHTTSLDAFWMGVPVLTQIGRTVVGRAGYSQLANLQLPELSAATDEQFIALGQRRATDLSALAAIRRELRDRLAASPLMNARQFTADMEAAFRQMWTNYATDKIIPSS